MVLRHRFKRSKSITHTTSMIFLLYQTEHYEIWFEIDSKITIYPRMKTDDEERTNHSHCLILKTTCLTWWTILVTINKIPIVYTCIDSWSYDMYSFSPQQKAEVAHSPTPLSCFPNQWKNVLHRSGSPHMGSGSSVLPCSSSTSQNKFTYS